MADYVLVHGGDMTTDWWNKITNSNDYPSGEYMGGKIWDKIVLALKKKNHRVYAPSLLNAHTYSLSDHAKQVLDLIKDNKLKNVILVGASYGGMVITKVADQISDEILTLVYLDAAFPDSGQSLFDILDAAKYEKSALDEKAKAYAEKLFYDPKKIQKLLKLYVQCTDSSFLLVSNLIKQKIINKENWKIIELKTTHIPQATMPDKVIDILLNLKNYFTE